MSKELIEYYAFWFQEYFLSIGMDSMFAKGINLVITVLIVAVTIFFFDLILRKIIIEVFKAFSNKTKTTFDDFLVMSNFPRYLAHLIPLLITWYLVPILFKEFPALSKIVFSLIDVYIIILCIYIFRSILRSIKNFLMNLDKYKDKPLDSYIQVLMIFAWGIGLFLIISYLTKYSIESLATLGAASAVIILIFKDTILGFVASIQVAVNDIVRIGDWITFSKYGADGYVTEINLATVRVQNFDNTYTTIPTYYLTSDSFQNWRGMKESEGRRIKRHILIKQSSVRFLTGEMIEKYKNIELIRPYLEHRQKENDSFNRKNKINRSLLINGKNQTNLGVFRTYAEAYLHENPNINKDMFMMVRYLQSSDRGIPVEIFCFSYDKVWQNYEMIQADIIDHLISSVSYFDLEIFELPSGQDFNDL
jgi:miniconductance mechanosensitive channel